jgi:hypothetical protein
MLTKFTVLWDAPQGVIPPHVLPLSIDKTEYENYEQFEKDVFFRLEKLGGYPVVGFMEMKD